MKKALILVFVGVVLVAGGLLYIYNPEPVEYKPGNRDEEEQIFCTQDAMQCPDGIWVGRTGPNCEFLCPSEALCEGEVCPAPEDVIMEDGTT